MGESARSPLDVTTKQSVEYCVPLWARDEQIKLAIARGLPHIAEHYDLRPEPIALVCFGPSLQETWEQIRGFQFIMSCSGAHKFLVEHGIIPTWHVEVDPRPHKVGLLGPPHPAVEYLIASTCHPAVFEHLKASNVKLWHVFDAEADALRTLPHGEWALTGGCSVGLRTMTIARFFGFTQQHIFGMDGSAKAEASHALAHPHNPKRFRPVEYPVGSGTTWPSTSSMLESARGTWHELDQMPDVVPTFYGEGLVQAMAKDYVPKPTGKKKGLIGYIKEAPISATYLEQNKLLHRTNIAYGVGGGKHAATVLKMAEANQTKSILDYGCGKGYLAKAIPFPIWEYDPAVEGKDESPRPADLVVCTDVLEHIEPDRLGVVLTDLQRVTRMVGYLVIHTGPASKTLPDGRNTHLIQKDRLWWKAILKKVFTVVQIVQQGPELYVVVAPKGQAVPCSVPVTKELAGAC
jgi:hypothetical protein